MKVIIFFVFIHQIFGGKITDDCLYGIKPASECCSTVPDTEVVFLRNPLDCNSFYQCVIGIPVPKKCPEGYFWKVDTKECILPKLSGCDPEDTTRLPLKKKNKKPHTTTIRNAVEKSVDLEENMGERKKRSVIPKHSKPPASSNGMQAPLKSKTQKNSGRKNSKVQMRSGFESKKGKNKAKSVVKFDGRVIILKEPGANIKNMKDQIKKLEGKKPKEKKPVYDDYNYDDKDQLYHNQQ